MRIGSLLLACTLIFFGLPLKAQEDCSDEPSGKALKLYEQSQDKKKNDFGKRMELLERAIEEDETCLPCRMNLAESLFKNAKRTRSSFSSAAVQLQWIVEHCPDYRADAHYYLGAIRYSEQEYKEALEHFNTFTDFEAGTASQKGKKFAQRLEDVQATIPNLEFYHEFFSNYIKIIPQALSGVSSTNDEYLPALSPDNEWMFYTRTGLKKAKGDLTSQRVEELTVSKRTDIEATFDNGAALPPPFNRGSNYGGATLSVDNKEMFVAVKNPVTENKQNIDIYHSTWQEVLNKDTQKSQFQWGSLEILGEEVNGPKSWDSQPSLSSDGKTLYFATIRPECITNTSGEPSTDIFYSTRQSDGSWSAAKSLGPDINTAGNDKAPFIHSDSKTLYFASTGHRGIGGYDLFYARQLEDGSWEKPKNIGHPVNSEEDEHGMIVSADGKLAYFASRRQKGARGFDIFSFEMPEEARPEQVMILKGKVDVEEGQPLAKDRMIELKYVESKTIQEIKIDSKDGTYAAIVNMSKNENVVMQVKADNVAFNARSVASKGAPAPLVRKNVNVKVEKLVKNKPFVIEDIYYETNSSEIDPVSKALLAEFAVYLEENSKIVIQIRGHTDDIGADADNLALSMDRAFSVKGFLEKNGVAGKRVSAIGYGEAKPVAPNDSEVNRALNRRTEFVVKVM